jgi:cystathionine gamma-lyase
MVSIFFSVYITFFSGFATRAIHAGNTADPLHGGVTPAIDLSTTYVQPVPGVPSSCFDYTRCGNPTVLALQRNLASLEKAKFAFALSSGMAATLSVLSLLKQGDHLLCIDDVYGGTQRYLR